MKRVVVTGMAGLCSLGLEWKAVRAELLAGRSGIRVLDAWDHMEGLQTRLGAPVPGFEPPRAWPRKKTRSMGRDSALATHATELALRDAGLLESELLRVARAREMR